MTPFGLLGIVLVAVLAFVIMAFMFAKYYDRVRKFIIKTYKGFVNRLSKTYYISHESLHSNHIWSGCKVLSAVNKSHAAYLFGRNYGSSYKITKIEKKEGGR